MRLMGCSPTTASTSRQDGTDKVLTPKARLYRVDTATTRQVVNELPWFSGQNDFEREVVRSKMST
jgi:hypothetical protein